MVEAISIPSANPIAAPIPSPILHPGLAFAIGYAFTMVPMLRTMSLKEAAKVTVIGDTVSIAAMETTEISLALLIPGFMHATLTDALFWTGLGIILPAGFAAAYPAMHWAMKRNNDDNSRSLRG
jgi:hypothetical protein